MIYDRIENMHKYFTMNPELEKAYDFLCGLEMGSQLGRHELSSDGTYANIEKYITQPEFDRNLEAHRKYIDVQYVFKGVERIGCTYLEDVEEVIAFDVEKDIGFYMGEIQNWINLKQGDFVVLLPHEAHLPATCLGEAAEVLKVVVKVPVKGEFSL